MAEYGGDGRESHRSILSGRVMAALKRNRNM